MIQTMTIMKLMPLKKVAMAKTRKVPMKMRMKTKKVLKKMSKILKTVKF